MPAVAGSSDDDEMDTGSGGESSVGEAEKESGEKESDAETLRHLAAEGKNAMETATWPGWWESMAFGRDRLGGDAGQAGGLQVRAQALPGARRLDGRPEAGQVDQEAAGIQEEAGHRPPEPEDHSGESGQARGARIQVEHAQWWWHQ